MRRGAVLVMLALVFPAAIATAGWAHGEDGTFTGLDAQPGEQPLSVSVRARLVYLNDAEPAPGATIVVEAIGPDGVAAAASPPLADEGDGTYGGSLVLPAAGAWTLRFTATTPNATADTTYTATTPTTTAPEPTTTTAPEPIGQTSPDDDDGGSGVVVIVLAVAVIAVVAGGAALLWRRRVSSS
jgi:hypothetical protein